jgi:hypothetical protein
VQAGVILAICGNKNPRKNKKASNIPAGRQSNTTGKYKLNKVCNAEKSAVPKMGEAQKSITD